MDQRCTPRGICQNGCKDASGGNKGTGEAEEGMELVVYMYEEIIPHLFLNPQ